MLNKAGACWAGEKISGRLRYEVRMAIACLGRAKCCVLQKQAGQQYAYASALLSLELSSGAGCKGFLVWMPCCANEAVLPGDLRCCTHVVLYHAV